MNTFTYTAFNSRGKLFRGSVQEKTWTQALRRVKEMGLFPTSVKEKSHGSARTSSAGKTKLPTPSAVAATRSRRPLSITGGISVRVLSAFTRQMATLLEAGIPILRALRSIIQQEENRTLRTILRKVITEIEGGGTFSEALARHPEVFSRLYVNMIVAGETAGMLESTLARLADFMERTQRIRSKIVSALFYPASVVLVAIGILTILMVFVVPKFKEVLGDLTGSKGLPPFTEFIFQSSQFVSSHLLYFAASAIVFIAALKLIHSTKSGRAAVDRIKLKLPLAGRITRKASIARFTRTLGTMLENGVPVLQALTISRETASNAIFARAIQETHERVKDGASLTDPLQASGIFPSTVISMIDVGEQTGALPNMLLKVAESCEDDVDNNITSALSLLEPALIIFLAVLVGSIVIALFLPLVGIIDHGVGGGSKEG